MNIFFSKTTTNPHLIKRKQINKKNEHFPLETFKSKKGPRARPTRVAVRLHLVCSGTEHKALILKKTIQDNTSNKTEVTCLLPKTPGIQHALESGLGRF